MDQPLSADLESMRRHWSWYVALGIGLALLGIAAIGAEFSATLVSVAVLGAIITVAGILQVAGAFRAHGAGHIFLYFMVGILDVIVGLILVDHPLIGALFTTLFLAMLFLVGGIFRFVGALTMRYPHYGWAAVSGIISCILGLLLWAQWPVSAIWFIGFAVGLNLLFVGASWIALGSRLHKTALPRHTAYNP